MIWRALTNDVVPVMNSWRDGLSNEVQEDLDVLYQPAVDYAERALVATRSIHPFGISLTLTNKLQLHIEEPPAGVVDGSILVRFAEEMLVDSRAEFKSRALILDTHLPRLNTDAIEMRLEHRDGGAVRIQVPYKFSGFRKRLTLGEMIVATDIRHIWRESSS